MGECFNCYSTVAQVFRAVLLAVWHWIAVTWQQCTEQDCNWWCLCCNKWLCWIALIFIAVLDFILFLVLEIVVIVVCTVIALWCILCHVICWIGCAGNKDCTDHCTTNSPCTSPTVEIDTGA